MEVRRKKRRNNAHTHRNHCYIHWLALTGWYFIYIFVGVDCSYFDFYFRNILNVKQKANTILFTAKAFLMRTFSVDRYQTLRWNSFQINNHELYISISTWLRRFHFERMKWSFFSRKLYWFPRRILLTTKNCSIIVSTDFSGNIFCVLIWGYGTVEFEFITICDDFFFVSTFARKCYEQLNMFIFRFFFCEHHRRMFRIFVFF